MTEQEPTWEPHWPICGVAGILSCIGICMDGRETCFAHAAPEARKAFLATLRPGADLDLRGTPIDRRLLDQLLAAVQSEKGRPTLGDVRFDRAQFGGTAGFSRVQFGGDARFPGAQFGRAALFDGAQIKRAGTFGPFLAASSLALDRATFEQDITIEAVGRQLYCAVPGSPRPPSCGCAAPNSC